MNLLKAEIINFRSIKNQTIKFSPKCLILVGINESGKSNILRALSLLSKAEKIDKMDVREVHPDEGLPEESYVEFYFDFENDEKKELILAMQDKIISNKNMPLILEKTKKLGLKEICEKNGKGVYYVDILKDKKTARYYSFDKSLTLVEGLSVTNSTCPANYKVQDNKGNEVALSANTIFNVNDFKEIEKSYHDPLTLEKLNSIIGNEIIAIIEKNLPEALFWRYNEDNLLPDKIELSTFVANPDKYKALKYMFTLTGIQNIGEEIKTAQAKSNTGLRNLLNRVSETSTKHLRSVWKDYKNYKSVKFELTQNGNYIDASIKDEFNSFPMKFRSDGFKQFATFLLMVSARVKQDDLKNTILLIDEPGTSLHPSGCRSLRDELIEISKKNLVIYSTHSIFMIDKDELDRHLIVKKEKEISSIEKVTSSNFVNEEVIFNALGHSIFSELKKKNIVFEGWRDKKLFDVALTKIPSGKDELKELKTVGACYVKGVKEISFFTPLLALADRFCLILSDSDQVAVEKQRDYKEKKGYGDWFLYNDLLKDVCITAEDFIKPEVIKKAVDKIQKSESITNPLELTTLTSTEGKLSIVEKWLSQNGKTATEKKTLLNGLKEDIFNNLSQNNIEEKYYLLLEEVQKKINT